MRIGFISIVTYVLIHLSSQGQELSYKSYSILEGVPGKLVFDVVQDSTGLIYFSSIDKVFTYDGYKWETIFEDKSNEQVRFHKLFIDSKGKIWIVPVETFKNIILLDSNTTEIIPPILNFKKSEIGFSSIEVEYKDTTRIIYAGTSQGVFEFKNNNWERISSYKSNNEFVKSVSLYNDHLYYSTENSVYSLNISTKTIKKIFDPPRSKILTHKIEEISKDEFRLWVLQEKEFGFIEKGKYTSFYNGFNNLSATLHEMGFISVSENEIIWGSPYGIFHYSKFSDTVKQLGYDNNIDKGAQSGIIDSESNLWFVSGRGIYKTRLTPFKNYKKDDGLYTSEVASIEFFADGSVFLGHEDGVTIINSDNSKHKKSFSGLPQTNRVLDAVRDSDNNIWFTAQFLGVGKMNIDKEIEWIHKGDTDYFGLTIDKNKKIWFTTANGLYKLDEKLKPEIKLKLDLKNFTRKIFESVNGDLILCLNTGIINYSTSKTTLIKSANSSGNSTYAYFDRFKDYKFVGTDAGLYVLESDTLKKFREGDFYIDQPVYFISQDSLGWIWFGLSNGTIKWDGQISTYYSVENGLAGMETNRSAGKATADGKFYIGTSGGLSIFNPNFEYDASHFFPLEFLYIEDYNGNKHQLSKEISLKKMSAAVTIYYRGYSFINENNNLFEISIKNDNEEKTDIYYSKDNFITIADLKPGNYILELRLKNGFGHWSKKTSNTNLRITDSNIGESITFILIGIFVAAFSFYISIKYRNKKSNKSFEEKFRPDSGNGNCYPKKLYDIPELLRIHEIILEKKYYSDSSLNINSFAEQVKIKPRRLSEMVNNELGLNFNSFLNMYRVEDAKGKLINEKFDEYSIEGISKLVGFKSKSSLHNAFKKYTGETPQSFKKRNRSNT